MWHSHNIFLSWSEFHYSHLSVVILFDSIRFLHHVMIFNSAHVRITDTRKAVLKTTETEYDRFCFDFIFGVDWNWKRLCVLCISFFISNILNYNCIDLNVFLLGTDSDTDKVSVGEIPMTVRIMYYFVIVVIAIIVFSRHVAFISVKITNRNSLSSFSVRLSTFSYTYLLIWDYVFLSNPCQDSS